MIDVVIALNFNQLIINVMVLFMVLASLDKCFGSHLGLGDQLAEALATIGPMCIPMVGMILISPLLGSFLLPLVSPLFHLLNADPAMFAGCILACDMGGYSLSVTMACSPEAANFSGCILASTLGSVISFTIPVGISMIRQDYRPYFAVGTLIGVTTIPIAVVAGGLAAGYHSAMIFWNTLPILLFSAFIALSLWKAEKATIRVFEIFGTFISAIATAGFAIGVIQELTSVVIIPDLPSVLDGIKVVGSVAIVLCGAYPLLFFIRKIAWNPIQKLGKLMGIDSAAVSGILGGFANIMPILNGCNHMSPAGVVVALAFSVSGSCMFGDHLGFVASVNQEMVVPMLLSKLIGSFTAVPIAMLLCRKGQISNLVAFEPINMKENLSR